MSWMVTVLGWFRAEAGLAYWTKRALRPWSEDETGPYPSFTSAISIFSRAAPPSPSPSAISRKAALRLQYADNFVKIKNNKQIRQPSCIKTRGMTITDIGACSFSLP